MTFTRTFGPVLWQSDEDDIETLTIRCTASDLYCMCLVGNVCTADGKREIPDMPNTPEWCRYREQAEADMREIKSKFKK